MIPLRRKSIRLRRPVTSTRSQLIRKRFIPKQISRVTRQPIRIGQKQRQGRIFRPLTGFSLSRRSQTIIQQKNSSLRKKMVIVKPAIPPRPKTPPPPPPPPSLPILLSPSKEEGLKFYRDKLRVKTDKVDLFDKVLRSHVVGNYILKYNNYYEDLQQAPETSRLQLPDQLGKMFVLSTNPENYRYFRNRIGPWNRFIEIWNNAPSALWQHILDKKMPCATVIHDNSDLCYSPHIIHRLNKIFEDVSSMQIPADIIYFGYEYPNSEGVLSYWINASGAQKLLSSRQVPYEVYMQPPLHGLAPGITPHEFIPPEFEIEEYTSRICDEWKSTRLPEPATKILQWPISLKPIFALSLRIERFEALMERMKHWKSLVQLFPATDGRKINIDHWWQIGRLKEHLTNGQVGCYESHCRMWKKIVDDNLPYALILEDDADIVYSQETVSRLEEVLSELKTISWDIVYIGNFTAIPGRGPLQPFKRKVTDHLFEMSTWDGLHTYYLSNRCARLLLRHAFPIECAVDIYIHHQVSKQNMLALSMVPGLDFVVPNVSDTLRFI